MTNELLLRGLAALAAAAFVAAPYLVEASKQVWRKAVSAASWAGKEQPVDQPPQKDDAHVILDIARRLQAAGSKRGVELCQQLLDVMLEPQQA